MVVRYYPDMADRKSKLVLGTVQLGMPYGVNNATGQPSIDEAFSILDMAFDAGIDTFDTAYAYGNSEEVIGKWLVNRGKRGVRVITKFMPTALAENQQASPADIIEGQLHTSLKRLGVESVEGYLLPTPQYLYSAGVIEGLRHVKARGLTRNIGVSIYDEEDALKVVDMGIDYIQISYNALDQRLDKTDFFQRAERRGVTVFARGPFLQGLLLMDPEQIPQHLLYTKEYVVRFRAIAQSHALTPHQAALMFVYRQPGIARIVFGVEKLTQLEEGLESVKMAEKSSDDNLVAEIRNAFKNIDRSVVNPTLWNKKKN